MKSVQRFQEDSWKYVTEVHKDRRQSKKDTTMNEKVTYYGNASDVVINWGSNDDPRDILEKGKEYTLLRREVHSWHTKYILKEFPHLKFNSVHFEYWGEAATDNEEDFGGQYYDDRPY